MTRLAEGEDESLYWSFARRDGQDRIGMCLQIGSTSTHVNNLWRRSVETMRSVGSAGEMFKAISNFLNATYNPRRS